MSIRDFRIVFIILFFGVSTGYSQLVFEYDTLTYGERMNSNIDSVDVSGSDLSTTFDGGLSVVSPSGLSVDRLFTQMTNSGIANFSGWKPMQFSALPHLGFSYTFGGQGSQFLKAKYNHAFTPNLVLDLRYSRSSGQGVIRNADFSNNDVRLQLQRKGKRYSFHLKGAFQSYDMGHPDGLTPLMFADSNSVVEVNGLEFATVNKADARSRTRYGNAILHNYFNVLNDTVRSLGVITRHEFKIKNRLYTESGDLNGVYDTTYVDSTNTNDVFNIARISNGGGVYWGSPKLYVHALVDYTYWKYDNYKLFESNEADLYINAATTLGKVSLSNDFRFNLMGRFNELSNVFKGSFKTNKWNVSVSGVYEKLAPTVFQRTYFSNTYIDTLSNIQTQDWLKASSSISYKLKGEDIKLSLFANYAAVNNVYAFDGSKWSNAAVNNSMFSVGVRSSMRFGAFNIHPQFTYSNDQLGYLPEIQASGRLFFKGKLFKAKKLTMTGGVDVSYTNWYKTKVYLPQMDVFNWNATSVEFSPMTNLHAFVAFGIKEFRFFFRYENIGYFWSDKRNQEVNGYPIARPRLRIGVTWDFFN